MDVDGHDDVVVPHVDVDPQVDEVVPQFDVEVLGQVEVVQLVPVWHVEGVLVVEQRQV